MAHGTPKMEDWHFPGNLTPTPLTVKGPSDSVMVVFSNSLCQVTSKSGVCVP